MQAHSIVTLIVPQAWDIETRDSEKPHYRKDAKSGNLKRGTEVTLSISQKDALDLYATLEDELFGPTRRWERIQRTREKPSED